MLIELRSKAGTLCQSATMGHIKCPLMVRSTSEDVVTDQIFSTLKLIQPRWWLPSILNQAMDLPIVQRRRFRKQIYRNFTISLWQKQPCYPARLLPWKEGATEVDVVIEWDNPPTTIFIEMKYGSDLSIKTARNSGEYGFPSDQLIRNIRIGLRRCGWLREPDLINVPKRDFIQLVLAPSSKQQELVARYADPVIAKSSIPFNDLISSLPLEPFVGFLSYANLLDAIEASRRFMTRSEKLAFSNLEQYLSFKANVQGGRESQRFKETQSLLNIDAHLGSSCSLEHKETTNEKEQAATCS